MPKRKKNNSDANLLLIFIILLSLISFYFLASSSIPHHWRKEYFQNAHTCAAKGCKTNKQGEYLSESSCKQVCKSYVIENGQCKQVEGIPWDSYSTKKNCMDTLNGVGRVYGNNYPIYYNNVNRKT